MHLVNLVFNQTFILFVSNNFYVVIEYTSLAMLLAETVGLEPTTYRLTADCSAN